MTHHKFEAKRNIDLEMGGKKPNAVSREGVNVGRVGDGIGLLKRTASVTNSLLQQGRSAIFLEGSPFNKTTVLGRAGGGAGGISRLL
jgi:hypothetical protein